MNSEDIEMFTRIVWNIEDARVAFARKGRYVMAWYCSMNASSRINQGDSVAFIDHVKSEECPKKCVPNVEKDKYDECFNQLIVTAHNVKRAAHRVPALSLDIELAKRA